VREGAGCREAPGGAEGMPLVAGGEVLYTAQALP